MAAVRWRDFTMRDGQQFLESRISPAGPVASNTLADQELCAWRFEWTTVSGALKGVNPMAATKVGRPTKRTNDKTLAVP